MSDNQDDNSHFILVLTNLTAVRGAEQKLQYLAHLDPLTDLPNRLLTMERLNQALLRGKRHSEKVGVLFIDPDNFKWINDSLGHSVGDILLKSIANRVTACLRADDTIGRLGGDEFLIVLDPVESVQNVALVAQKLLAVVIEPLQLETHVVAMICTAAFRRGNCGCITSHRFHCIPAKSPPWKCCCAGNIRSGACYRLLKSFRWRKTVV